MVSPLRCVLSGLNIPSSFSSTSEATVSWCVTVQVCPAFHVSPLERTKHREGAKDWVEAIIAP